MGAWGGGGGGGTEKRNLTWRETRGVRDRNIN